MKFSMLLATYGTREKELIRLFDSLTKQTYKNFEVVIVTQTNHDKIAEILSDYDFKYKHVPIQSKGVSKARNAAWPHITGDVVTFTDDDCWYAENALEVVKDHFEKYDSDVLLFKHIDPEKNKGTREYPEKVVMKISKMDTLKQISFDMYVNTNRVKDYAIPFDERFGVGMMYNSGEENIYIMDVYNKGYKISFFPETIAYHPFKECNYLDAESFIGKGPLFKRLFGPTLGLPMFLAFGIKKKALIDQFEPGKFWGLYKEAIKECNKFKL